MDATRKPILAACLLLWPASASADMQAVSGNFYLVINNSRQEQTCSIKWPGTNWSPWFRVGRAGNWQQRRSGDLLHIQCRPPVRQAAYALRPGLRYALLPARDGTVELLEVTAGGPNR